MAEGASGTAIAAWTKEGFGSRLHGTGRRPGPSCCLARAKEAFSQVVDLWGPP